MEIEEDKRL